MSALDGGNRSAGGAMAGIRVCRKGQHWGQHRRGRMQKVKLDKGLEPFYDGPQLHHSE